MSYYYCCSSIGSAMSRPDSDFSRWGPSRRRVGWAPRATPHFNHCCWFGFTQLYRA